MTKEKFFSTNVSLAYRDALAYILNVNPDSDIYRTTQHSIVKYGIQATVEVYCDKDNYIQRYNVLQGNASIDTFSRKMSEHLHYPVHVSTDVQYPDTLSLKTVPSRGKKG